MKLQLDRAWIIGGKIYGPGSVEVPDADAETLRQRGATEDQAPEVPGWQGNDYTADQAPQAAPVRIAGISDEQMQALHDAGYTSADQIRAASDDELDAVERIGKATIQRIRQALASEEAT